MVVNYYETYAGLYEVEGVDNLKEAEERIREDIMEGRRQGPDQCCDSGIWVTERNGRGKKKLAKILYGMSLGLDYADGIEYAEEEIKCITEELEGIGDSLRNVLETIASTNEDMEKFVDDLLKGE